MLAIRFKSYNQPLPKETGIVHGHIRRSGGISIRQSVNIDGEPLDLKEIASDQGRNFQAQNSDIKINIRMGFFQEIHLYLEGKQKHLEYNYR